MSNWKKLIVSGSGAHLSSVTASNGSVISGSLTMSGSINNVDHLNFYTTSSAATATGRLVWNDGDGTLDLGLKGGTLTLQLGQDSFARVYNAEATTLNKGEIVYISGSQGNRISVKRADNDIEAGSANTLGMVSENISSGAEGFVFTSGIVNGLNTIGLTAGATLYLSSSGQYTQTPPVAPKHTVIIGFVERVHATVGSIFVKVNNGYELGELHNVLTNGANYGDLLMYSASLWTHSKQLSGSYGVTGSLNVTGSLIINGTNYTAASSGTSGTAGSSGTSGANGSSGTSGSSGTAGSSGASGTSGSSGASGTSGSSGASGTSGSSGSSGASGTSGSSGASGTSGSSGASGTSGSSGASGTSGSSGASGTSGSSGASGTSGSSGASGTSGSSGSSGETGASGTSGSSGASGTSGSSGSSGETGASGTSGSSGASGTGFNTINSPFINRFLVSDGTSNAASASAKLSLVTDVGGTDYRTLLVSASMFVSGTTWLDAGVTVNGTAAIQEIRPNTNILLISGSVYHTGSMQHASSVDNKSNVYHSGSVYHYSGSFVYTPTFVDYQEKYTSPTINLGNLDLNLDNGNIFEVTVNGAINNFTFSNPPYGGNAGNIVLITIGTGTPYVIIWPASVSWPGGTPPAVTSTNGKKDIYGFISTNQGTNWYGFIGGQNL